MRQSAPHSPHTALLSSLTHPRINDTWGDSSSSSLSSSHFSHPRGQHKPRHISMCFISVSLHLSPCSVFISICHHAQCSSVFVTMLSIHQYLSPCSLFISVCQHAQCSSVFVNMLNVYQHMSLCTMFISICHHAQ